VDREWDLAAERVVVDLAEGQAQAAEPVSVGAADVVWAWDLEQVGALDTGLVKVVEAAEAHLSMKTTTEYATIMKLATERTNRDHLESARFGATMEL